MNIFLTGMMRSGTTLLQRALNQHPNISVSYQDRTEVFLKSIKKFHKQKKIQKYHLLSHYSPNNDYSLQDIQFWMENELTINELLPDQTNGLSGVKEVLAEEFLPFLINKKVKCINIIRDPRDVIASMSFGNGLEHTGLERPVLFDIKNWRKSVLISQIFKDSKYLLTIRMEDLLHDPESEMANIYKYLEVAPMPYNQLIKKLNESSWKGNSSFGDKKAFDSSAIGNYKIALPNKVIEYIEVTCNQEMKHMGYKKICSSISEKTISSYSDPFTVQRDEFVSNYSSTSENVKYEVERYALSIDKLIELEFMGYVV